MKSLRIALLLLVLMIAIILCNAIYINKVAFELSSRLSAIPPPEAPACLDAARDLCTYWDRHIVLISFSTSDLLTERISDLLTVLTTCAEQGDRYGFHRTLARLCNAVDNLRQPEMITLHFF